MSTLSLRDRIIPWYFVLFFVVIALVDGVMVTLAVRTHTGIVTEHPYEKGLAYNDVVSAEKEQEKLGWNAAIRMEGDQLRVALTDAAGRPLSASAMTAHFYRPTQSGMDFDVALPEGRATINTAVKGLWAVRIFATVNGKDVQYAKRLVIE